MSVFDLLPTEQRLQIAIRKALEQRRSRFEPREGYVYRGAGDLLLRHGRFFQGRELPERYQHLFQLDGGQGNCFRNAYYAARESGLRYFEGIYGFGAGHFTPHAWLLDPEDGLLELTALTDPASIARGAEMHTHLAMLGPEHWGYWGVELHPDYVEAVSEAEDGYAGTLDRPIHDALFNEGPDLAETRDHWPVYTYPYNPDRRDL